MCFFLSLHSLIKTKMRKKIFIATVLLFSVTVASYAQTIDWKGSSSSVRTDSIAKKILEPTRFVVTYTYRFVRDAARPDDKRTGLTVLEIGNRYNRFCDYYGMRFDSICDEVARGKISVIEASPQMLGSLKKRMFKENIVIDRQASKETVQREVGMQKYQYEEDCPELKWEIQEGDTTIAGYRCGKARTSLFGRDYIAWYAPEVNMPYGPYKFNGLPGLVFSVTDTQGNFEFTISGLEQAGTYVPIYLWTRKDIVKTSRKRVRDIYRNYCADPVSALETNGVMISDDVKSTVEPKPYNPIELE